MTDFDDCHHGIMCNTLQLVPASCTFPQRPLPPYFEGHQNVQVGWSIVRFPEKIEKRSFWCTLYCLCILNSAISIESLSSGVYFIIRIGNASPKIKKKVALIQLGLTHVCVILSRRSDTITQTWSVWYTYFKL